MLSLRLSTALKVVGSSAIYSVKRRRSHFSAKYLGKNEANFVSLSPLSLFLRAVQTFPNAICYHHEKTERSWSDVGDRIRKIASALSREGVKKNDVVSVMAPNSPSIFECHFAVPAAGAVLHSINTRSDAHTIAFQLQHAKTKVLVVDSDYRQVIKDALAMLDGKVDSLPYLIEVRDEMNPHLSSLLAADEVAMSKGDYVYYKGELLSVYDDFIRSGDSSYQISPPKDEWDAISLNFTSGTTGNPKGVVCHHRGAYLNAISNALENGMARHSRYLWIVPMFHCNGWCFPWTMAAIAGTSFFLRDIRPKPIFDLIKRYKIQFFAGAPITMHIMLNYPEKFKFNHEVRFSAGGAPPPPAIIKRFKDEIGVICETVYGLTEVYGPVTRHIVDQDWLSQGMSADDLLQRCTYQCANATMEEARVMDPQTMKEVPADGKTLGEVMLRGNIVMAGYLGNEKATTEAFKGGWFHTGDLAVRHPNNRFELKDRAKDIIISGGENISSIEVENILISHPAVGEVAVVAMPHDYWGEVPCAFVTLRPVLEKEKESASLSTQELINWARDRMAHYMAPKEVRIVEQLPKTSTGKVQKHELRKLLVTKP